MYLNVYLKLIWSFICPNESKQIIISMLVFLVPKSQLNKQMLFENTQRLFDAKKTLNVSDIHLIWLTQTAKASYNLYIYF